MFEKSNALRKVKKHVQRVHPHMTIQSVAAFEPYAVFGAGGTPFLVFIKRGERGCPMVHFGNAGGYAEIKQMYSALLQKTGHRGYHVSVNEVRRLKI